MTRAGWRKQHKWTGWGVVFFLASLCLSGIVLNHRRAFSGVDINRGLLPSRYHYVNWNNGLLRGTLDVDSGVILYGSGGMYLCDKGGGSVGDFNTGLPAGADERAIRAVVSTPNGVFAVSQFAFYRLYAGGRWGQELLPLVDDERISDMTCRGDTIVVVGRSYLYLTTTEGVGTHPEEPLVWQQIQLPAPVEGEPEMSLFRIVWKLHSGELFGTVGRLVADAIAVILLFLGITGIIVSLRPQPSTSGGRAKTYIVRARGYTTAALWHNKVGRVTIVLTLLIVVTGWCLRPPMMIPLVMKKTSLLNSYNPWNDKLRMLRYDATHGDWLLSTSDGFYSIASLDTIGAGGSLRKLPNAPQVSVMGLNAWQQGDDGRWVCCSFSGVAMWDRDAPAEDLSVGRPMTFGSKAVAGYTTDIGERPIVIDYTAGTDAIEQPHELRRLPMSLWNVALEMHSGRLFFGNAATLTYVFIIGLLALWCLWSGWKMSGGIRKRRQSNILK